MRDIGFCLDHHDVDSAISELSQNVPSHPLIRPLSSQVGQNHSTSGIDIEKKRQQSATRTPLHSATNSGANQTRACTQSRTSLPSTLNSANATVQTDR